MNVTKKLVSILRTITAILFTLMLIVVILQVIGRFYSPIRVMWFESAAKYLYVAVVFLGIPVAFYNKEHIAVISIFIKIPEKYHSYLYFVINFFVLFFLFLLLKNGIQLADSFWAHSHDSIKVIGITKGHLYLVVTVGAFLSFIIVFLDTINLTLKSFKIPKRK
jgi:TRAP-type C4-dicarboxylate transport system permease small subunit